MSYSPVPNLPEAPDLRALLHPSPVTSSTPARPPDTAAVLDALRAAIAKDSFQADQLLQAITEAAHTLTGASAAALAMRKDGLVICRARSGDCAPEVGSRLSVDSGLSGECLRMGKVLRCDDTQKDYRTDPEVCQRLGLRSIAAVPLRGRRGAMGVLETFSTRPYAFAEEHMNALVSLAELAEATRAREVGVPEVVPSAPEVPASQSKVAVLSAQIVRLRGSAQATLRSWFAPDRRRYWATSAGLALLALIVVFGWNAWRKPSGGVVSEASAKSSADTVQVAEASAPVTGSSLVFNGAATVVDPGSSQAKSGIQLAAKLDSSPVALSKPSAGIRTGQPRLPSSAPVTGSEAAHIDVQPGDAPRPLEPTNEAPSLSSLAPGRANVANLIAAPANIPQFGSPVSAGVSGGVIQHRVQPTYPVEALPAHLQGTVILQATVGENGKVKDLKIVSGHPTLARAALDAVRQWRYSPYMLNGKPVPMQTQISVSFKAP